MGLDGPKAIIVCITNDNITYCVKPTGRAICCDSIMPCDLVGGTF